MRKVFFDDKEQGGRPHTDELVVVRALLLQGWYGLSDPELEFQINDRLSFRNFLGFPETVPDFSTVWKIRERLQKEGIDRKIWDELQRQLDEKGYEVKKGVIQDASFVEADLGRKRHYQKKKAEKEGRTVQYTEKQKAHIDHDGTFSVKHGQVHYGYKAHVKIDADHGLIRAVETSTASLHDSQVDLVKKDDVAAYRDKGYFGTDLVRGVEDMTMKRATKSRRLNGGDDWFTCLLYPEVPPDNNEAERSIRPFVIIRKIIGCLRSEMGKRNYEVMLSMVSTWEKQGKNVFYTLQNTL